MRPMLASRTVRRCANRAGHSRTRPQLALGSFMGRFNLGAYRRAITTQSAEAQRCFDIGLNWCYGFNHDEGIKCFEQALVSDPGCAMVHWGIAYASGPFYNLTWKEHGEAEADSATKRCFEHVQLARANSARASSVE